MSSFFSQLSYSFGNEDWSTEQQALKIQPDDRVLCITASGDRPLNLLFNECKEIVSIDANKQQNYLLQLKIAAMQNLSYKEYLAFLGADPSNNRTATLKRLSKSMNKEAFKFWSENDRMISKGVLYQGSVERVTRYASRVIRLFRGRKIKKLFEMSNLDEQREFVKKNWDCWLWRKTFECFLHPYVTRFFFDDPGLQNHHRSIKPGTYIYERMNRSLENCLARENVVLSFYLKGKVQRQAYGPYLTFEGTNEIKKRLDRVKMKTENVVDYLEKTNSPSFDCFSLSDVASYISKEDFIRMLRGIVKTANPGARFCMRQFLSSHEIPVDLQPHFKRDIELEKRLEKEDKCFVYRFLTGTILK